MYELGSRCLGRSGRPFICGRCYGTRRIISCVRKQNDLDISASSEVQGALMFGLAGIVRYGAFLGCNSTIIFSPPVAGMPITCAGTGRSTRLDVHIDLINVNVREIYV